MARDYSGILGFAQNAIQGNPQLRDDPQYSEMVNAIMNNDSKTGQQIAMKLLKSYGVTPEQAINRAMNVFNLPFNR